MSTRIDVYKSSSPDIQTHECVIQSSNVLTSVQGWPTLTHWVQGVVLIIDSKVTLLTRLNLVNSNHDLSVNPYADYNPYSRWCYLGENSKQGGNPPHLLNIPRIAKTWSQLFPPPPLQDKRHFSWNLANVKISVIQCRPVCVCVSMVRVGVDLRWLKVYVQSGTPLTRHIYRRDVSSLRILIHFGGRRPLRWLNTRSRVARKTSFSPPYFLRSHSRYDNGSGQFPSAREAHETVNTLNSFHSDVCVCLCQCRQQQGRRTVDRMWLLKAKIYLWLTPCEARQQFSPPSEPAWAISLFTIQMCVCGKKAPHTDPIISIIVNQIEKPHHHHRRSAYSHLYF